MKKSVKKQMYMVFFVAVIIPVLILGIVFIYTLVNRLQERYEVQIEAELTRVKGILFDITTTVYSNCELLVENQEYREFFSEDYGWNSNERNSSLEQTIEYLNKNTIAIESVQIYTSNPGIAENEWIKVDEIFDENDVWYPLEKESIWNNWCSCSLKAGEIDDLILVRKINTGASPYEAFLVATIDRNYLKNRLVTTDSFLLLAVDGEQIFFSSNRHINQKLIPLAGDESNKFYTYTGPMSLDGKKALTAISTLSPIRTSNNFYILVSDTKVYEEIVKLIELFIVMTFSVIIGSIILVVYFTTYFSNRIMILRSAMHQVSQGDYNIIEGFNGQDELADVFKDLKNMVNYIHKREADYYQTQLNEQKLLNMQQKIEFKMLASQINPHFLYNTLETIRMQAVSYKTPEIAESIMLLAKSMHYVLENTKEMHSTLEQELEHVTNYLMIQKLRFQERISWHFYIDEMIDIKNYIVLPLLLQPIVENAIVHGLENKNEVTHINVIIEAEKENKYIITVSDNGGGIEEEKLQEIIENLDEKRGGKSFGIALNNINQRIKLHYGDNFGVTIQSVYHKGTSVSLTLPRIVYGRDGLADTTNC